MSSQAEKCARFAALHSSAETFLIPNPWDIGSAKLLQGLGFAALATTSAGFAYTLGRADGDVTLEEKLTHCAAIAGATSIPVSADFENGFADDPEDVAGNVIALAATGVAGCSIEDYARDTHTLYPFDFAVERVHAAAEAVASLAVDFQLTARAENLLRGVNDLDDTIARLRAFEDAGANVLYAPGLHTLEQLCEVTGAISRPFNVLAPPFRGATVSDFANAGAKRISVGSALTWAAVNPLLQGAGEMLEHGTFDWLGDMASSKTVNGLLSAD
ncbi:MAG: isocitrate lyase/PEP mutase family protein [Gammaproteobacteria bacterium]|jgi:2-methylisocitrate lyase-like PEP mutase family enzyme